MALKQLILNKKINERSARMDSLRTKVTGFQTREADLAKALEEAETEEDVKIVEESAEALEAELQEVNEEIEVLESEKADLEKELADLEEKQDEIIENEERGSKQNMTVRDNKTLTIRESMNINEVRDFYEGIQSAIKENRSIAEVGKVIPTQVLDRIESKLGDYSTLINEVALETLNGSGRAVIAGDIPEAVWTEMTGALNELEDAFEPTEIDGYSLGGFVPVHNSIIEDALINLAAHVEDRIAKAIAKSLDKAILKGEGATKKQPVGATVNATKVTSDGTLPDLIGKLGEVDTDGTGGEVIAVMNRKTYYKSIVPQTLAVATNGAVAGTFALPFRVVLSAYADDNTVVFGDFKQYLLAQRAQIRLESSTDVKFIEDQTVFKGVGRYDGKPVKDKAFAVVTIANAPEGA